jgi:hypothetical protein
MDTNKNEQQPGQDAEGESLDGPSLEQPATTVAGETPPSDGSVIDATGDTPGGVKPAASPARAKSKGVKRLTSRVSIYLLLLVGLLFIAVVVVIATYLTSKRSQPVASIPTQNLSSSTLEQLANGGVTVGSSDQVLNVQSSAVFANKALFRQDLEVAGNLQIGKTLAINDLNVAGTAQFSQLQASKDLSVAGNTSIQGTTTIGKSLQVNGAGNFSGALTAPQLTVSSLQLNGDLVLTHHITAGGATPGRTSGGALGSGGTSSLSGSDTSGSININTGTTPAAGCFITVNFVSHFNATPHVLVTPVGSSAGGLSYYVNRSASNFSVCVAAPAPANASFGFDYWVVD